MGSEFYNLEREHYGQNNNAISLSPMTESTEVSIVKFNELSLCYNIGPMKT